MPVKAKPTRKVSSISRPITGWVTASPTAAQRLGRWLIDWSRTLLSRMNSTMPLTATADRAAAMNSGVRNPAGPMSVWAKRPPTKGPTIMPTFQAAPCRDSMRARRSGGVTSAI